MRPDPPLSLNWTLLNLSPSGLNYDVMVNWKPPPSADVKVGWMRIEYEIQYRERNTTNWEAVSLFFSTSLFSFAFMHTHTLSRTLIYLYIYKNNTPFRGKKKKCSLVPCSPPLPMLTLEEKCMQLCWRGGGSQRMALWENTASLKEVRGGICRSEFVRPQTGSYSLQSSQSVCERQPWRLF